MEPEPSLEHLVGLLVADGRQPLGRLAQLLELQVLLDLLAERGVDRRRRGFLAAGGGRPAAVAAGGHPDAGEGVGGLGGVLVVAGAEEFPQGEHGLVEPLVHDALAGVAEEFAVVRPGVAGVLLELVRVEPEAAGGGLPGRTGGPHVGGARQELVGDVGHGCPRGRAGDEVYRCTVNSGWGKSRQLGGKYQGQARC
ncbi:hypothetical protein [Urbifossiella limnaea]|uniref:hypothetical protein n=1 Tax=Urbifossiella limnaea TaxID=2528023 RepID=UPI0011A4B96A|nr:hypothetical protein [Urbifossiella limnaea]